MHRDHFSSCSVYVVRHGQTDWNAQGRIQGHTDIPLNEMGVAQALELKNLLAPIAFSAVYSSDLSRAKKTAELILDPRPLAIIESPSLRERWAGSFEGKYSHDLDPFVTQFFFSTQAISRDTYLSTPWHSELESAASVIERVKTFLIPQTFKHRGQAILLVTHGGVVRSLLDSIDFVPGKKWIVSNCAYVKLNIHEDSIQLSEHHGVSRVEATKSF